MPQKLLDITKIKNLGYASESQILLCDGIQRTYKWYLDNKGEKNEI
jgi:nucleoside-diphosphate-sugar epimerase